MPDRNARRLFALVAGVLLVASLGARHRGAPADPPGTLAPAVRADAPAHCCFTHPRYVGTCDVEPSGDETCASILAYLNNPQSQGKAYCGSTSVRGDWKAASCEARKDGN